jgi:hypothetical protein
MAKKLWLRILLKFAAGIGILAVGFFLLLLAGFLAVRFGLTNVAGDVDPNSNEYNLEAKRLEAAAEIKPLAPSHVLPDNISQRAANDARVYCQLDALASVADYNAGQILQVYQANPSYDLVQKMILAVSLRLPANPDLDSRLAACEAIDTFPITADQLAARFRNPLFPNVFVWQNGEPWGIIRQAIVKDKATIDSAATVIGVSPRLLVSIAIVEQLRLYYTQRELFETIFKPLKILANANKMAWGVMSIKEAAAIQSEQALADPTSPWYLGAAYEHLLDFKSNDPAKERYDRLTDKSNHYYSYLYGGLIIRQAEEQWAHAGFPIANRPEIIATLFNIGLQNSHPKADPAVGGSEISIENNKYVFGSLAYEFYYSGDLAADFPFSRE